MWTPYTKEQWLEICAERYMDRAGIGRAEAEEMAITALEVATDFEGSEERALSLVEPRQAADDDMACWDGDA